MADLSAHIKHHGNFITRPQGPLRRRQDEILAAVAEVLESQVCIRGRCREWIQSLKKSYGQSVTAANPAVILKALAV
jgi:hypothetical protein